jgi:hypothetical protein
MKRALVYLVLAGCPKDEHAPAPGVLEDAAAPLASAMIPTQTRPPAPSNPPCRAIAITGKITDADAGTPLAIGGTLADTILLLDDSAKMTVKAPESGREITFRGPGRVRACVGGDPEHWLLEGTAMSTAGSGEKPGAEEWIVTPFGIARYASAMLEIKVVKDRASLRLMNGSASVFAPRPVLGADASATAAPASNAWTDASPISPIDMLAPGPAKPLVDACARLAKEARDLGAQVVAPGANLSDLAPKHVQARKNARAACALARVAAAAQADKSLVNAAEASDAAWRVVVR